MSLTDLAAEVRQFGETLAAEVLPTVGPALRQVVLDTASEATGGRFMRQALDARAETGGDTLTVIPVPAGPWSVLEAGSIKRQWWEPARRGGKRLTLGDEVRIRVLHGPIKGRRTWTTAQERMSEQFFETASKEAAALWEHLGG
jgi:hypothetical protein